MEGNSKNKLERFKEKYEILRSKYSLPNFEDINHDFEIEKIADKETDLLIRNIRREILEKITNYMRFLEALMNSSNAPILFMALANQVTEKERKIMNEIYTKFGEYFIKSVLLDNDSNDEKEIELILEIVKDWNMIKVQFNGLIEVFDANFENKKEKKSKNYIC
jgi:hypothetical protein